MTIGQRFADRCDRVEDSAVAVVGLGYVGMPLAVAFAEAGIRVVGIDLDQSRVDAVNRGVSHVPDVLSERLAAVVGGDFPKLSVESDYDAIAEADAVLVCVPTPLSKTRDPDIAQIVRAADEVAARLHDGMLVVLESTTYPGTTEDVLLPRLQGAGGVQRRVGEDFFLAFSPERIDPGRKDWTIANTPKVVGGVTPRCTKVASALYARIVSKVVPVSSPRIAEMTKLLENTFRSTNIALVNEMAIMCDRLGVDVWEVIDAASTKPFGFMPFYPGPGLGGHCIPIDPQYLAWKLRTLNYDARFIRLADEVNFGMPAYVVGKITDALNEDGKAVKGSKVLVLGVAYKPNVNDVRESPALDMIQLLGDRQADVVYNDPLVPTLAVAGLEMSSVGVDEDALSSADCIVIATDHGSYDWPWILSHSKLVVDTRNATGSISTAGARVVKI